MDFEEIAVIFSYYPSYVSKVRSFHLLKVFANALRTAIGSVENAPIYFSRFQLASAFGTNVGVKKQVLSKYRRQAVLQLFRILGSIQIIGSKEVGYLRTG